MTDINRDTGFFGHPKGLQTLFFTEMWERMSYYGMRALLILFMTATLEEGGLALTVASASAIYGLYTGAVYFMGLPGGWLADRLMGGQKAVWYGGIIIMCGHIVLAIPSDATFFIGLILVVLGTGLLKPNISALVGQLYEPGDQRQDSGYILYYMGINIGSVIGYIVCGVLQVQAGWHYAFGAAAVGMFLGLVQFHLTRDKLNGVSAEPTSPLSAGAQKMTWSAIFVFLAATAMITYLIMADVLSFNPTIIAQWTAGAIAVLFCGYYIAILVFGKLNRDEMKSLGALFLVCVASVFFWSGFEQAGSSLNLFAQDYTERMVFGWEIPTAWFQSANSVFIITLSPFIAALWINLAKRMITPTYGVKCALGLIIMGSGFIVMFFAAQIAASGLKAAPYFLVATYFLHTVGELCLSPVALSAVSRLSPRRFAGQMMGVFVLTYSMGNIIAGLVAGNFDPENVESMPDLFKQISIFIIGSGIVVWALSFFTKSWEKAADKPENTKSDNSAYATDTP
ncbi:MAG: peptide MFS transporter [Pseudomonadota bacterium]